MRKLIMYGICLSVLVLSGCTSATPQEAANPSSGNTPEAIKIGVIAPLSGPGSTYGKDVMHGITYVQNEINTAGGINGTQVELIVEDGKCNGKGATAAVNKLIHADNVEVIIGGVCSGETIPAGKIAQQNNVVMVSPTASSHEIIEIGDYVYRYYSALSQMTLLADYFEKNNISRVLTVHENTEYGKTSMQAFQNEFSGTIIDSIKVASEEADYALVAKNILLKEQDVEAIVFVPQTEATAIGLFKAMQGEGRGDLLTEKVYGVSLLVSDKVITEFGKDIVGIKAVSFMPSEFITDSEVSNAIKNLLREYTPESSERWTIFAADVMRTVVEAIKEKGYDAEQIKNYIQSLDEENPRSGLFGKVYFSNREIQGIQYGVLTIDEALTVVPVN